ncbi:hypothetical protein Q4E93_09670 [Flavitalea sp. BT771]|uniref:hypothetical protein n=1 Tax=Flavitalea sp. BT771 TaxID=3063329 RepID=UPI0026E21AFD|nr:hypothetical protein [Flavitalea sp. BT771]MDO6430858.1 hypothetical protein [Flavitalea sp. BT771]MDV6219002.1 hypothetical protein [Flavitalea sp. BT771]
MSPRKIVNRCMCFSCASLLLVNTVKAQQSTVDSTLLNRVAALEQQVADQKHGESHFMVVGLATFGFVRNKTTFTPDGGPAQISKTNSLGDADRYEFSPMLLWRHGTKWLLEFEPAFDGSSVGVNWANISYFAAPGVTIRAGYFVLPFGIYNKRLAAGWIDKVAPDPVGIDLPGTDFGIGISGGLPLGNMKWSYDVSLTNGLQLLPDGELQNAGVTDNNTNKTVCGRLALLPFSNSSLEIGASGLYGGVADAGSNYHNANTTMYGADLSYVNKMDPFLFNIKGQYSRILVNSQQYMKPTDSSSYSFDNKSTSAFAQISIRPVSASDKLIKNLELAFRYVNYTTPGNSIWGAKYHEEDIGLDYWLNWRSVLKFTYAWSHSLSTANVSAGGTAGTTDMNNIYLQFSIQL